jgi:hypothetical protein
MHDARGFDLTQPISSHNGAMNGEKSLIGEDLEPSAADNLKSLVQECGVSPHKISELLQELPPSRSSDVLIDYYFSSMCVNVLQCMGHSFIKFAYCEIEIGLVIPFPSGIFVLHMHQSLPTVETGLEPPIRTMFDSSPFYLSSLLLPSGLPQNISLVIPVVGESHLYDITGLVRVFNFCCTLLIYLFCLQLGDLSSLQPQFNQTPLTLSLHAF